MWHVEGARYLLLSYFTCRGNIYRSPLLGVEKMHILSGFSGKEVVQIIYRWERLEMLATRETLKMGK